MKTENNYNNKLAFQAQYFGQNVIICKIAQDKETAKMTTYTIGMYTLLLTPIDQITDNHLERLFEIHGNVIHSRNGGFLTKHSIGIKGVLSLFTIWRQDAADYLRSKGYAVPWRDLSVEDLVFYGWVKLKEL